MRARHRLLRPATVLVALCAGPALAVQPIPLAAGLYCGPGDARIVVDVARDQVTIDGQVCSDPVIAADRLQSNQCSTEGGRSAEIVVDLRVVGPDFVHDHAWYRRCGDVPAAAP